jgi:hypothetical protein
MQPALSPPPAASPRPSRPSPSHVEGLTCPPGVASSPNSQTVRTSPQRIFFRDGEQEPHPAILVPALATSRTAGEAAAPAASAAAATTTARPCAACGASPLALTISGSCAQCQPELQRQQAPPLGGSPAPATADAAAATAPQQPLCEGGAQTEGEAPRPTSEAVCQYEAPAPEAPPPLSPQQALVVDQLVAITGETREGAEAALRGCGWGLEAALLGRLAPVTSTASVSTSGSSSSSSSISSSSSSGKSAASGSGSSNSSGSAGSGATPAVAAVMAGGGGGGGSLAAAQAVGAAAASPTPPPKPAAAKPARTLNFITKAS